MEPAKDIYHKEEPPVPPRRRRSGRDEVAPSPPTHAGSGSTAHGLGRHGAPVSPIDVARQHLQMQPQQHLRRRRRRDSGRDNQRFNRLIWVLIGLVVVAYGMLLVGSVVKNRLQKPDDKKAAAAAAATAALARKPVPEPTSIGTNLFFFESGLPIAERVQKWSKGARVMDEVQTLLNNGRFSQAREKLAEAQALVPNAVDRMFGLASVYMAERNFQEAEKLLVRVVESDPLHTEARQFLAKALKENGRYVDALAVADWICQVDPYSDVGHELAADASLALDEPARAVEHLRKLSNLRSGDLTVRNNLGIALMRQGNLVEARKTFEEILRSDEHHSTAHYNLAVCQTRQGKPADVVITLRAASAKLGESFVWAWLGSADFAPIRTNAEFVAFERKLGTSASASNKAASPSP